MAGFAHFPCQSCGRDGSYLDSGPPPELKECGLCVKLGMRSLVRYMRLLQKLSSEFELEKLREAFAAAKGRSYTPHERSLG